MNYLDTWQLLLPRLAQSGRGGGSGEAGRATDFEIKDFARRFLA